MGYNPSYKWDFCRVNPLKSLGLYPTYEPWDEPVCLSPHLADLSSKLMWNTLSVPRVDSLRWPFLKSVLSDAKGAAAVSVIKIHQNSLGTPNHNLSGHRSLLGNLVRPARVKRTTSIEISSDSGCYIHSHILKRIYKDVKIHKTRHKSQQSIRYWGWRNLYLLGREGIQMCKEDSEKPGWWFGTCFIFIWVYME